MARGGWRLTVRWPEKSPELVDDGCALDGGHRWVQHDIVNTNIIVSRSAVAPLDFPVLPNSGAVPVIAVHLALVNLGKVGVGH